MPVNQAEYIDWALKLLDKESEIFFEGLATDWYNDAKSNWQGGSDWLGNSWGSYAHKYWVSGVQNPVYKEAGDSVNLYLTGDMYETVSIGFMTDALKTGDFNYDEFAPANKGSRPYAQIQQQDLYVWLPEDLK